MDTMTLSELLNSEKIDDTCEQYRAGYLILSLGSLSVCIEMVNLFLFHAPEKDRM